MMALLLLAAAPTLDCDNALAQQDMNQCAHREFERADAELNAQWRITSAAMKEADREIDPTYDRQPTHFDTLLAAQRAWLAWRDQHCLLSSFEMRGGSMAPLLLSSCKSALTKERTAQLKDLVETEN